MWQSMHSVVSRKQYVWPLKEHCMTPSSAHQEPACLLAAFAAAPEMRETRKPLQGPSLLILGQRDVWDNHEAP